MRITKNYRGGGRFVNYKTPCILCGKMPLIWRVSA